MDPFVGEITLFAFGRTPQGWMPCNGQVLNIAQYAALASLLGATYGGDGKTTFGLPDLRGKVVVNQGVSSSTSYPIGLTGGAESVALTIATIPPHSHTMRAVNTTPATNSPLGQMLAQSITPLYATSTNTQALAAGSMTQTGSGLAHENRQPSIALQFCIATVGLYPSRP